MPKLSPLVETRSAKSYAETAIVGLTAEAELTRGALYHQSGGKKGFLVAVMAQSDEVSLKRLQFVEQGRWCFEAALAGGASLGDQADMPFKHNASRRNRIPKARYRIRNWPTS